jgi:acetoacetate decarboxylase
VPHPPAPWRLTGDLWLSLFRVSGAHGRPDGLYGAAFVHYVEPSPLTYHELLVARLHRDPGLRAANITDIWVDSVDSMHGGRELWAIPKDLAEFERREEQGPVARRTTWRATLDRRRVATAAFTDVSHRAPRLPLRGATWQQRHDGTEVVAPISGTARTLPARSRWTFAPDGPLGFLAGRRAWGSARLTDFAISFG